MSEEYADAPGEERGEQEGGEQRKEPTFGESGAGQQAAAAGTEEFVKRAEAAEAKAAELEDRFLRAKAETENIRRRAETDVANVRKYAIESFANELLPVRDSLELAKSVDLGNPDPELVKRVVEGLDLTLKLMDSAFGKFSLTVVDPQGEKFDPEQHQAMTMQETDELPPNHVAKVIQKGYLLNNRLLRPAMVIVSKPKAGGDGAPAGS